MEHSAGAGSPQRPQHPLANYQFSPDELRVFRECNSESFFQRSLPLGVGFGVTAFFGVKNGYLRPNVKYGAVPKVVVGVVVGYFLGKFSYQQKCAEKLMRLPNSRLGEILRQRKFGGSGGGIMSTLTPDPNLGMGLALSPFTPAGADIYSDEDAFNGQRSTSLNLDVESRPALSGLDDIYRPSLDTPSHFLEPEIPIEPAKVGTTYEELRQRNREEYEKKQKNPLSRPLSPDAPVVIRQPDTPVRMKSNDGDTNNTPRGQKNKYGDTWTE